MLKGNHTIRVALLVLAMVGSIAQAEKPVSGKGFTCVAQNGVTKRINIDLATRRFQEAGEPSQKIQKIEDGAVVLRHYSTVTDGFYLDYKLDRSTLILSSITDNGQLHTYAAFQCQMSEPFDFAAERRF